MLLGSRKNVLLVKDDVGQAKPTTKDLPENDFAYGRDKRYVESAQQGTSKFNGCGLLQQQFLDCCIFL